MQTFCNANSVTMILLSKNKKGLQSANLSSDSMATNINWNQVSIHEYVYVYQYVLYAVSFLHQTNMLDIFLSLGQPGTQTV